MKMNDLKVAIPIRFKDQLMIRFDLRTLNKDGYNFISCPLCDEYKFTGSKCVNCPFKSFELPKRVGCDVWIEKVLKEEMDFTTSTNRVIAYGVKEREQIKRLKKKARKLITWI